MFGYIWMVVCQSRKSVYIDLDEIEHKFKLIQIHKLLILIIYAMEIMIL